MPNMKKETEVRHTQTPATGSSEPRYDNKVEEEAKQLLQSTNKNTKSGY